MRKLPEISAGELIVIAARPGCGKTTFAVNLVGKWVGQMKTLYVSCEMTNKQIAMKLQQSFYSNQEIDGLDDISLMSVEEIRKKVMENGYKLVVIDHLQIFPGNIKTLTKELKALCLETGVCIIALSQLNRKAAETNPEPWMLRDSGNIEQDADQIWFIKEHSLYIAKNRWGSTGEIGLEHEFENSLFWFSDDRIVKAQRLAQKILMRYTNDKKYRFSKDWLEDCDEVYALDFETGNDLSQRMTLWQRRRNMKLENSDYCPNFDIIFIWGNK